MRFSPSLIEYRLREIKKIEREDGRFDHNALKPAKIQDKIYKFFKFKVCFQYFKLLRQYTYWQVRSRLKVSIISHGHWTQELIF